MTHGPRKRTGGARRTAEYGAWPSRISASDLAAAGIAYSLPRADGADILWCERRPAEDARVAIVRARPGAEPCDAIPPPFSARSRVHEYGGGQYAASGGRICFVNETDEDLWLVDGGAPSRLTEAHGRRFADMAFDPAAPRLYAICERHVAAELPQDTIVAVEAGGAARGRIDTLLAGRDFYANPRPSPDGSQLAWLAWDLPSMPWEAAELWIGRVADDGGITEARSIAGGGVFQPEWGPDGALYFVAARDGWGNLHVLRDGKTQLVAPVDADFSRPLWSLGATSYAVLGPGRLIAAAWRDGVAEIGIAEEEGGRWTPFSSDFTRIDDIAAGADEIVINGGGDGAPPRIHRLAHDAANLTVAPAAPARLALAPDDIPHPRVLSFPNGGFTVRALYFPPASSLCAAPKGALPPLVVCAHGGPTAMARRGFALDRLYWTTRGFAVLDVDYRGSTGYGAAYRRALDGMWGEADADDAIAAAHFAAAEGLCDPSRMVIRGSSAGGLTVLNALIRSDIFAAGASLYGVTDLERLAADTHKFESGYLVSLLGGTPGEVPDIYEARSPVNHAASISAPVIFFQGLDDKVVPPSQSRAMAASLRERAIPVALVEFAGEGHGFRRPATIIAALEGELAFYARILGLEPAERLAPIDIDNLGEPH